MKSKTNCSSYQHHGKQYPKRMIFKKFVDILHLLELLKFDQSQFQICQSQF